MRKMARPRVFDEGIVLDRAMAVFWRNGYDGASMAALTKAMGINSPSIYVAFGSKRGLFDAVLKRYRERRAEYRNYVLSATTAREVAERLLFGAIDWLVDPKEPLGCLTLQAGMAAAPCNDGIPRALIKYRKATKDALSARFSCAKAQGDLTASANPTALANYLFMVFSGLAVQAAEGLPKAELQESAERALAGWPSNGDKEFLSTSAKTTRRKSTAPGGTRQKVSSRSLRRSGTHKQ
jgi:AcrR family transcriptional regulator